MGQGRDQETEKFTSIMKQAKIIKIKAMKLETEHEERIPDGAKGWLVDCKRRRKILREEIPVNDRERFPSKSLQRIAQSG